MRCTGERVIGKVTVLDLASRTMRVEPTTDVTDRGKDLTARGREAYPLRVMNLEMKLGAFDSEGDALGSFQDS